MVFIKCFPIHHNGSVVYRAVFHPFSPPLTHQCLTESRSSSIYCERLERTSWTEETSSTSLRDRDHKTEISITHELHFDLDLVYENDRPIKHQYNLHPHASSAPGGKGNPKPFCSALMLLWSELFQLWFTFIKMYIVLYGQDLSLHECIININHHILFFLLYLGVLSIQLVSEENHFHLISEASYGGLGCNLEW